MQRRMSRVALTPTIPSVDSVGLRKACSACRGGLG
jgi:hypothetical protein